MSDTDPDALRSRLIDGWEHSSLGWGRNADSIRDWGMPVSAAMIERLDLQAGERLLELAAGPGDTGFLAAELIAPGGTLICSDAAEGMLEVARRRAAEAGLSHVEFKQLQLEWIDLETATVDAILCRWGVMLVVDPQSALGEMRRVLKPGGRAAVAVWAPAEENPWASIPSRALSELGHLPPPEPGVPTMFGLGAPGLLAEMLQDAGFTEVTVNPVALRRRYAGTAAFLAETRELSGIFARTTAELSDEDAAAVEARVEELVEPFRSRDAGIELPGSSLVALAGA
jgi:SAM-dependent methyltransferase